MQKQFNYVPKDGMMSYIWAFLVPALVVIVPIVMPFGIRVGRMVILPYPYSTIVLVIIGICLLIYQFRRYKAEQKLKENARPIIVEDGKITFVRIKKGKIEDIVFHLSDVKSTRYDNEEETLEVSTSKGDYTFDSDFFDNKGCFNEFMGLFSKS